MSTYLTEINEGAMGTLKYCYMTENDVLPIFDVSILDISYSLNKPASPHWAGTS